MSEDSIPVNQDYEGRSLFLEVEADFVLQLVERVFDFLFAIDEIALG